MSFNLAVQQQPMERVLVIDDDVGLCELVGEYLQPEGYTVEAIHNGEKGVDRALSNEHDLVVLDVMLPGTNGFDVLRRIRARSRIPVLMLTARGDDVDRIVGLEIGADDYLPKPFNPRELVARIRAVLRRAQPVESTTSARETIRARQHHIEHNQIVFVRQRAVYALLAVVDRFNRITFRLKILSYQLAETDVVVDYKHTFHWLLYSKI